MNVPCTVACCKQSFDGSTIRATKNGHSPINDRMPRVLEPVSACPSTISMANSIADKMEPVVHKDEDEKLLKKHILKLYKLDLDVCKSRSNRNCVNNPRCLKGLGQPSWLIKDKDDSDDDDNFLGQRKTTFCGLKNLGATCYLNTFLQLWYHNVTLRKSFYNWRPVNLSQDVLQNPIMSLQQVFSMMQFSKRSSVDPTAFIKCLKLDESQEQDAHEFSNLLVSYIQNKLLDEADKSIHDTINKQYSIKIAYVIRCNECNFISERESEFHELLLRVKGFKTIEECIDDYLGEESLDGSNQYACQICNRLQDAKRFIELRNLPPVLSLQLLRFDSLNGRSKKISSFLSFPNKLDMNKFVRNNSSSVINNEYNLFAVLIHEGHYASSGHYITFIKREDTWYKFNDESVERLKDFNLKIDSDDDFIEGEKKNVSCDKPEKGCHKSKNAYMLVYRHKSELDFELPASYSECNLPEYLTQAIDSDNQAFAHEQEELFAKKATQRESELNHRQLVREIYSKMETNSSLSHEAISKDWLVKFFQAKVREDVPPVNNDSLLCGHKFLDMMSSFKCISKESSNLIYTNYGGGPRIITQNFLCNQCLSYKMSLANVKNEIDIDSKRITNLLKFKSSENEQMFWIGKESLKKWKQLRISNLERKLSVDTDEDHNEFYRFNHDLLCQHGNLSTDPSKKRLIKENVWKILFKHFPESPCYTENSDACFSCSEMDIVNQQLRDNNLSNAVAQRSSLQRLLEQDDSLNWHDLMPGNVYHIISSVFYHELKKFLAHPNTSAAPAAIVNDSIICKPHQQLLFPPLHNEYVGVDKKYIIVNEEEWAILLSFYECPKDVFILKVNETFETTPAFCECCYQQYVDDEKRKRYIYSNESIYVHKVVCDEESEANSDVSNECLKKSKLCDNVDSEVTKNENSDEKNFINGQQDGFPRISEVPRRSTRRRRYKNELEIKVSSFDKLKDIKFKIMQHFNVATYDQTLMLNGKQLSSFQNNFTLAELEIEPYSVIILRVDDKSDENVVIDSQPINSSTEGGFKGTQLHLF